MKKKLIFVFSLLICGTVFSQEAFVSDISVYEEISQSFENKYYPGTIEKVNLLQKKYPDSVFIQPALVYKAKSLINLNCYEEAIETLEKAIAHMHTGKKGYTQCNYLLGLSYFYLGDYYKALEILNLTRELAVVSEEEEFSNNSIFYSAECYFNLAEYGQAYPLYEQVMENKKEYSPEIYERSVINLITSYNKIGSYDKTIDLVKLMDISGFSTESQKAIVFMNADAYEKIAMYDKAYELYCQIIKFGEEDASVVALKNAYSLSNKNKINSDFGDFLLEVTPKMENNPDILNEIWIRLGIDEYNKKNYSKAEKYFSNVTNNFNVINIYRAKIILDTDFSATGGKKAEEILLQCKNINEKNNMFIRNVSDSYYSIMLQCKIQQNLWDDIPNIYKLIENPDSKSIYINSAYYYYKGEYEKVEKNTGLLYPSALCKLRKFDEAALVYADLDKKGEIDERNLIDYSKVLFIQGKYEEAYSVALRSIDLQKEYICGLCKINTGDLKNAKDHFITYIKQMSNDSQFNVLALYYKAYIEYDSAEYKNAYASFVRFATDSNDKNLAYVRKSHKYAAIAALQNKDYENASMQALNVIKKSITEEDKRDGTVFAFEVLADCKKYDEALELMTPYIDKKSDFTAEAIFRVAGIYEKLEKIEDADNMYIQVYTDYPKSSYAEEAMYRCGEVYYFAGDYVSAYNRFNKYIYEHIDGKFIDAALFFSGDCAFRLGELNKSIMINKNLGAQYPESAYNYGAGKNLLFAYYEQENYTDALEIALGLLEKYPEQAEVDKIKDRVNELEKIVKGTDRRIVEKLSAYEAAGGIETKEGRIIGSEIVKLYAENSFTQKDAYELAMKLLEKEEDDDELTNMAENAEFVGDYKRANHENKEAAEYYLKAAKNYRSVENDSKAAAVLYGAVEAFVAEGLTADAKETADLLKKLYPYTKYAERVDKIVR